MRNLLLLVALLCAFTQCRRPESPQENRYAVTGVLNAALPEQHVRVQRIDGGAAPVTDAEVVIWYLGENHTMTPVTGEPGFYGIPTADVPFMPGDFLGLRVEAGGTTLRGEANMPEEVILENISGNVLVVNEESTGAPLLDISWEPVEGMLYVMTVTPIGSGPHPPIPFPVESGNFDVFFGLPFDDTEQTVFDTDFALYGLHQITIYAMLESYEQVFLYPGDDFTENLEASPDNIENGSGYLTGVSQTTVTVELVP